MDDEEISRLRGQIAGAHGRDRAVPLVKLGWAHLQAYVDAPPGSGLIRRHLEDGVSALDEGRLLLSVEDPVRAQAEATLGNYHASQGISYWCEGEHLEKAARLLDAALASGSIVPVMADYARFHRARVHLSRYMAAAEQSPDAAQPGRARELLLGVARRGLTRSLDQDARILLAALVEPSRDSLERAVEALRSGENHIPLIGHVDFDPKLNGRKSRRHSHSLLVRSSTPTEPIRSTPRRQAVTVDVERMRREAWNLLPRTDDPLGSALELLRDERELPWLDRFLALAATIVDTAQPSTAADHSLLALGYLLRSRREDDGWEPADSSATAPTADSDLQDLQAALASLLTALICFGREAVAFLAKALIELG